MSAVSALTEGLDLGRILGHKLPHRLAGSGDSTAEAATHAPETRRSHAGAGAGPTPVVELRQAGAPVGLGCDASSHSAHSNMWLEAHSALLALKGRGGAGAITAREILEIATVGSAACLGRDDLGRIRPGAPADLVAWDLDEVAFAGAHTDLVEAWLRCGPVRVRHNVVNGKPLVEDGTLRLSNLPDMLAAHRTISRRLQGVAT